MNAEFTVRQATPADMDSLKQIVDLSFPRLFRFFASNSLKDEGQVLVSETKEIVVGFAKLTDCLRFHVSLCL